MNKALVASLLAASLAITGCSTINPYTGERNRSLHFLGEMLTNPNLWSSSWLV